MRLGVFGGSFNPPHIAHLIVAEFIRDRYDLERIIWIPASTPPHKQDEDMPAPHHRLAMVQAAVAGNPAFDVSDIELRRGGVSFTLDTLEDLRRGFGEISQLFLIIGSDSYEELGDWHRPESILKLADLLVYPRGASPILQQRRFPAKLVEAPLITVSGTNIRRRVREGRSIRYLVSESVGRYIEAHGLYRGEEDSESH